MSWNPDRYLERLYVYLGYAFDHFYGNHSNAFVFLPYYVTVITSAEIKGLVWNTMTFGGKMRYV